MRSHDLTVPLKKRALNPEPICSLQLNSVHNLLLMTSMSPNPTLPGPKNQTSEPPNHYNACTYCVLSVKAALVILDGKLRPLHTSLHSFLLMTSTSPPLLTTKRNNSYRSRGCLAMMGIRFTGVPGTHNKEVRKYILIR